MTENDVITAHLKAITIYKANDQCMTVEECASFLNIHQNTVKNRIHRKEIVAEFVGRVWRIPKIQFLKEIVNQFNTSQS